MINVLVVEDDPMVAQLHEHYLGQIKGFQLCDMARSGDEALRLLQTKEYDLLILDVFMPSMDGLQLLAKIRENGFDVDVIIVSAANDKDKIKQALRLGAVDYIIKPFEFERFNLALNNYLKRYHIVEDQEIIEQSELDKTIIRNEKEPVVALPKGLDKNTLAVVWKCILTFDGMFTTEEAIDRCDNQKFTTRVNHVFNLGNLCCNIVGRILKVYFISSFNKLSFHVGTILIPSL